MIGLDSNVLIRFLVRDDEAQALRAARLIGEGGKGGTFVSLVTLAETVWSLRSTYGLDRTEIAKALGMLLSAEEFVLEAVGPVRQAWEVYRRTNADFADALIGALGVAAGCSVTATFDRKAARLESFMAVP